MDDARETLKRELEFAYSLSISFSTC